MNRMVLFTNLTGGSMSFFRNIQNMHGEEYEAKVRAMREAYEARVKAMDEAFESDVRAMHENYEARVKAMDEISKLERDRIDANLQNGIHAMSKGDFFEFMMNGWHSPNKENKNSNKEDEENNGLVR